MGIRTAVFLGFLNISVDINSGYTHCYVTSMSVVTAVLRIFYYINIINNLVSKRVRDNNVLNKYSDFSFYVLVQFVTDAVSVERILGKGGEVGRPQPVEYCVVCGDKASGKNTHIVLASLLL